MFNTTSFIGGLVILAVIAALLCEYLFSKNQDSSIAPVLDAQVQATTANAGTSTRDNRVAKRLLELDCSYLRMGPYFLEKIAPKEKDSKEQNSDQTVKNLSQAKDKSGANSSENADNIEKIPTIIDLSFDFCGNVQPTKKEDAIDLEFRGHIANIEKTIERNIELTKFKCPKAKNIVTLSNIRIRQFHNKEGEWEARVSFNLFGKIDCGIEIIEALYNVSFKIFFDYNQGSFDYDDVSVVVASDSVKTFFPMFLSYLDIRNLTKERTNYVANKVRAPLFEKLLEPLRAISFEEDMAKYRVKVKSIDMRVNQKALDVNIRLKGESISDWANGYITTYLNALAGAQSVK